MVQALPGVAGQPQNLMHFIVEKTSDSRSAKTRRPGLEVEHLSDHSRLPVQPRIHARALFLEDVIEAGEHAQGKSSVRGDGLAAAQLSGGWTQVAVAEGKKWKILRTSSGSGPGKIGSEGFAQGLLVVRVANQNIQTRSQAFDPVNEDRQRDVGQIRSGGKHRVVGARQQTAQQPMEVFRRHRCFAVHGHGAAPAADEPVGRPAAIGY